MKRHFLLSLALALSVSLGVALGGELRPAVWAAPVTSTNVTNLYRVEPDLYRSGQPDAGGFRELAALGVKTVLDLKGGDGDGDAARRTGLRGRRSRLPAGGSLRALHSGRACSHHFPEPVTHSPPPNNDRGSV